MVWVDLFLWLITYSVIGWIYESALCSVLEKRVVNRGFLNGPLCPIYGSGALAVILILYGRVENIFLLFFLGMLLTCTLEYVTAVVLEKLFHAKWWDYSSHRFHINGRVSLAGAVVFGTLSVVLVRYIHPAIAEFTARIPEYLKLVVSAVLLALFLADLTVTVWHLVRLNGKLAEIQAAFDEFREQAATLAQDLKQNLLDKFESSDFYSERISKLFDKGRIQSLRLIRAFPKLRPLRHNEAWEKLKQKLPKLR